MKKPVTIGYYECAQAASMKLINEDTRIILRELGMMIQVPGIMALFSLVISLIFQEYYAVVPLLITMVISLALGMALYGGIRGVGEVRLKHGMIVAALGWLLISFLGAIPFYLIAQSLAPAAPQTVLNFSDPLNAFFESVAGFTGTGLTMTERPSQLPHILQWWRSFTQWIGSMGIIVLMLSIIGIRGPKAYSLYYSEARQERMLPSISATVRTMWWIYVLYTGGGILLLWIAGMPIWQAINHAMTGIATGGFSVTDGSIASYNSLAIELALLPLMIFGAISFAVHYELLRGNRRIFFQDFQTRWLLILIASGVVILAAENLLNLHLRKALRDSAFQFISAMTTTGFQTAQIHAWSSTAKLLLATGMIIGGAAGSTVGGIKVFRAILLAKGVRWRFRKIVTSPVAVLRFDLGGLAFGEEEANRLIEEVSIIVILWLVFLGAGILILLHTVPTNFTLSDVIFEVVSAQSGVGLSTGVTGPYMSPIAKLVLCFNMWIGRLEIIPVLLLLRAIFVGVD